MKKELFTKLLLALFVVLAGVSFTACDDDDEPQTQIYTYGWQDIKINTSDLTYLDEMATVEDAFKAALGKDPITLNGSSKDCDAKIVATCKKVEESLKDQAWGFTARFEVTNGTAGKVVYSLQFTKGSNLF